MQLDKDDRQFLAEVGGGPLEGSGFESESADRNRKLATLREPQKIGSLACFVPLDKLPTDLK